MKAEQWIKLAEPIIAAIEEAIASGSEADWTCPWRKINTASRSVGTGHVYTGSNALSLWVDQFRNPHHTPIYGTYKQWEAKGMQVAKGAKGTLLTFYTPHTFETVNDAGESMSKTIAYSKGFVVFNSAQLTTPYEEASSLIIAPDPIVDEQLEHEIMRQICAPIHWGGNRAGYSPSRDIIVMPHRIQFYTDAAYWGTLLHEGIHATGHESRLNRLKEENTQFGSEEYAFEELVAELGSHMLSTLFGIVTDAKEESVSYLRLWAEKGRLDPSMFHKAASKAAKACDFMNRPELWPARKEENKEWDGSLAGTAAKN